MIAELFDKDISHTTLVEKEAIESEIVNFL